VTTVAEVALLLSQEPLSSLIETCLDKLDRAAAEAVDVKFDRAAAEAVDVKFDRAAAEAVDVTYRSLSAEVTAVMADAPSR